MASVPAAIHAPVFPWLLRAGSDRITSHFKRIDDAMKGVLLLMAASVFFSISDAASKFLTTDLGAIQIGWVRYLVFVGIVVPLAFLQGGRRVIRTKNPVQHVLRGVFMVLSTILFVSGLAYLTIADATAINYISPLFITALAIPLLGEKVGVRRWAAAVGLIGVLIIVQPGSGAFQLAALFPIGAALVWAFAAISTRMMCDSESPQTTMLYSSVTGFVILCALVPFSWQPMTLAQFGIGSITGAACAVAHLLFVLAYRYGSASLLAPFSYVQIIWASLVGFIVFGSIPGIWTFVGSAVIAASGLYTAHRERVKAREAQAAEAGQAA